MTGAPTDLVGQSLGPYHLDRLLGQGGFAWVFAGREADGTEVAVKVLKPRYAGDAQFESRFRNESETAAKLSHPNIVRIRSVSKVGANVCFAMDLYADSLGARLTREGKLPEDEIVRIALDVVQGLSFAHLQGLVHRDMKPDNILLDATGRAVITDFGLARAVSRYSASTGVNMTIGTPQYLSPEQAQGRAVDQRSDIYSLGITLYRAATGEVPFSHPDWFELARMHVEDPPAPPRKRQPELSKRFERVVLKCLAKHPDDRYQSAAELAADLADIGAKQRGTIELGTAPLGTREMQAVTTPATARPWRLIAAIGIGLALLVILVVQLMR